MYSNAENIMRNYKNYYQVMGLNSATTAQEISKTFKKLALKWHPDRHQEYQKSLAHRRFIAIVEAYEVLGNPERRSKYDIYRRHHEYNRSRSNQTKPTNSGMNKKASASPKNDPFFEFSQKFEKELHKWSKKAGNHARSIAKNSYLHSAVSLEIVSKLVMQGIFHTVDIIAGKGKDKKVLNEYKKRLEQKPNDSVTHYRMGFLYHQNGDYEEAANHYLGALKINPKDADVFCNLGRLREEQNKYDRAISCYSKAVKLNPDLYIVYAYLGILHLKMEHYIDAKICLDYLLGAGQEELASQIKQSC